MPQSFTAISLGKLADIDIAEGNNVAENASALVGQTFGHADAPLAHNSVTWNVVGNSGSAYDMNNMSANDRFSIDGGPPQTFDGTSVYNATITYFDGSTARITAVVAQDVDGNTYLMPEFSDNSDQAALEAGPVRSITLNSLAGNRYSGLTSRREDWDLVPCFTPGSRIATPRGEVPGEALQPGDKILTRDNGIQEIRWIGSRMLNHAELRRAPNLRPVLIKAGSLGNGLPERDMLVSPQHRMLVGNDRTQLYFEESEVLVAAKHLIDHKGIRYMDTIRTTYIHFMFDRHEVVLADGAWTESFQPGDQTLGGMGAEQRDEIYTLFPELQKPAGIDSYAAARKVLKGHEARLITR